MEAGSLRACSVARPSRTAIRTMLGGMADELDSTRDAFTTPNACPCKTFDFFQGQVKKHKKQDDGREKSERGNRRMFPKK